MVKSILSFIAFLPLLLLDIGFGEVVTSIVVGKSADKFYWVDIDNFDFFKGVY